MMGKIRFRKIILLCIITLLGNSLAMAQTRNEFSAKQAVDYGLKNAVQVKNALIDIKIQQQTNREITAAAFPQINGSVNTTHFYNIAVQTLPNFISPSVYEVLEDKGV